MKQTIMLGYLARLVTMLGGIVILPFTLKYLHKNEFAVWMIFLSASSLVNVLDFGFMSSFSRYFSYIYGGTRKYDEVGLRQKSISSDVNYAMLRAVYKASIRTYAALSLVFIAASLLLYVLYFIPLFAREKVDYSAEWLVFSFGLVVNIFFLHYNALLAGMDKLEISYMSSIVSGLTFVFLAALSVFFGAGLMGLCMAKLASVFCFQGYNYWKLKANEEYMRILKSGHYSGTLTAVFSGAFKIGLSTLGSFLTNRASTLIVAAFLTLSSAGELALAAMLFATLVSVCLITLNSYIPKLAKAFASVDRKAFRNGACFSFWVANIFFVMGAAVIVFLLPYIMELVASNNKLPKFEVLLLISLTYFFEMNQQISTTLLTVVNRLAFVYSVLIFGVVYVLLSVFALSYFEASMVVAILCQMTSQMLFNNWYWPLKAFKIFREGAFDGSS